MIYENARPDFSSRQSFLGGTRIARLIKPKQWRSANKAPAQRRDLCIEPKAVARKPRGCGLRPSAIRQCTRSNLDRRTGNRPGPDHCRKFGDIGLLTDDEAEPHAGKAKKLSERADDQESRPSRLAREREAGHGVDKAFVNHQPA